MFPGLASLGLRGIEIAPTRIWDRPLSTVSPNEVETYRKQMEAAGLRAVGLHSLFFDRPDLRLFGSDNDRADMLDHLALLSRMCRDFGGRSMVFGSPQVRQRGTLSKTDALDITAEFLQTFADRTAGDGTCLCFEPLAPDETDFANSILDVLALTERLDCEQIRIQMDTKALAANGEASLDVLRKVAKYLVHVHASEPGLAPLASTGAVPHQAIGEALKACGYEGFVTIEQIMVKGQDPLAVIAKGAAHLQRFYGHS